VGEPTSQRHEPPAADDPPAAGGGSVVPPTKAVKIAVAVICVALAGVRFAVPTLPIDATFLGLLAVAVVVLVFDVESVDALGIHARMRMKQLARAEEAVATVPPPAEPIAPPPPPTIIAGARDTIIASEEARAELHPVALTPPVDPAERLLWAAEQMRVELIVLAGNGGHLKDRRPWTEYHALLVAGLLTTRQVIPGEWFGPIGAVVAARNDLVHGQLKPSRLVESSATLALDVLTRLREIKRNYIRVREGDVDLYKDQLLTTVLQEARGVMLVELDPHGTVIQPSTFPRGDAYARGSFVSWEWDLSHAIRQEAWYRDLKTTLGKLAWSSSATFVGRPYPPQWGLEYRFPRPDVGLE
jgi:hypothetical protein